MPAALEASAGWACWLQFATVVTYPNREGSEDGDGGRERQSLELLANKRPIGGVGAPMALYVNNERPSLGNLNWQTLQRV